MKKVKGLGITKKQILDAARAKALSYVSSAPKKNKMTPKEKKALAIYEVAKGVGGCQQEPLLELLDVITGLPVSKAGMKVINGIKPNKTWREGNVLRLIVAGSERNKFLCLGTKDFLCYDYRLDSVDEDFAFDSATRADVDSFFENIPEVKIGLLLQGLIE